MEGKTSISIKSTTAENGKKMAAVLKNISETVSEPDLLKIYDIIQRKPDFFSKVVSKLDSPVVKMALGI